LEREVNPRLINKEINYAVMMYQGIYDPIRDEYTTMRRSPRLRKPGEIDGLFSQAFGVYKDWGWSWPMNVRFMYNYDSLVKVLGTTYTFNAAGRTWTATGGDGRNTRRIHGGNIDRPSSQATTSSAARASSAAYLEWPTCSEA
jgi:formate dehydrogenase major subunit